ncbi:hypothetical protein E3N88_17804 [Mikania micrantha]|uniref:Uncharacterized protein n=1 Tax=Mikania micrantha TaxID=192012 RepID=A0A5N6NVL4_9ASTR|nr:hypothetical protein E3N88_17804 [Mikania micrantha]
MANNRGEEVVDDDEYHSQPAPKASKWIFQKWRCQPKQKSENASSSTLIQNTEEVCLKNPHEDKSEKTIEDVEEIPQQKRKGAIPNEESNKWSQDHIEGWVTRMMRVRGANFRKNGPSGLRWTILPQEIRDILILNESKFAAIYPNGTHELYPPFWEVDYVYIPLCIRVVEDWYLVRINLQTMELVQYWPNKGYAKDYRRPVHFPTIDVLSLKFDLLDEIQ